MFPSFLLCLTKVHEPFQIWHEGMRHENEPRFLEMVHQFTWLICYYCALTVPLGICGLWIVDMCWTLHKQIDWVFLIKNRNFNHDMIPFESLNFRFESEKKKNMKNQFCSWAGADLVFGMIGMQTSNATRKLSRNFVYWNIRILIGDTITMVVLETCWNSK